MTCPCGRPTTDTYLCHGCHRRIAATLTGIPALVVDLELTMTKQRRFGDPIIGGSGGDLALPYNPAAAGTLRDLNRELARVVRLYRLTHTTPLAPDHSRGMAAWLLVRLPELVALPLGLTLLDVDRVAERGRGIIDAPADRTYAGPCDHCGHDLYAKADEPQVTCRCGVRYDLAARRTWLLDVVDDRLATAVEIARALTSLELPVTAERIRQWKHRDRLTVRGSDQLGRPLFRVGDVVDLLVDYATKRGA